MSPTPAFLLPQPVTIALLSLAGASERPCLNLAGPSKGLKYLSTTKLPCDTRQDEIISFLQSMGHPNPRACVVQYVTASKVDTVYEGQALVTCHTEAEVQTAVILLREFASSQLSFTTLQGVPQYPFCLGVRDKVNNVELVVDGYNTFQLFSLPLRNETRHFLGACAKGDQGDIVGFLSFSKEDYQGMRAVTLVHDLSLRSHIGVQRTKNQYDTRFLLDGVPIIPFRDNVVKLDASGGDLRFMSGLDSTKLVHDGFTWLTLFGSIAFTAALTFAILKVLNFFPRVRNGFSSVPQDDPDEMTSFNHMRPSSSPQAANVFLVQLFTARPSELQAMCKKPHCPIRCDSVGGVISFHFAALSNPHHEASDFSVCLAELERLTTDLTHSQSAEELKSVFERATIQSLSVTGPAPCHPAVTEESAFLNVDEYNADRQEGVTPVTTWG